MKNALVLLLSLATLGACKSANNSAPSTKYEEKKASLADMEKDSPLKFLKISGSHRKNLLNQTVVEGEIVNKATLTDYKNIQVQITFIDKDGSTIEKQKHSIDDVVKAASTEEFKIKVSHVSGATSVSLDIVDATADK